MKVVKKQNTPVNIVDNLSVRLAPLRRLVAPDIRMAHVKENMHQPYEFRSHRF